MNHAELLANNREAIHKLAHKHRVTNLRVFGSVARGESDADSDIDILVELEPGSGLLELGGFLMDVRELLGVPVDVTTPKMLKERIRERVLGEATPI